MKYTIHQNEKLFILSIVDLIFGVVQFQMLSIILNSILFGLLVSYLLYKYKWKENMFFEQLIFLYYCSFQIALRGVPQIWFIFFALGKQTVQLVTLIAVFIYTCFDFEPIHNMTRVQQLCEQIFIIIALIFYRYHFSSLLSKAKQNLAEKIQSTINYSTYDQNLDELEKSFSMDQFTVHTTTIISSRCENQKLQQAMKRDFKIKCYSQNLLNNLQEQISQEQIPLVFDNIRSFIETYQKQQTEMDKLIIVANEIDKFTGQKVSYRIYIKQFRWFRKLYFVIAFVNLNNISIKQNKNIEKFKQSLAKIFTHKLKTPLNTTLGFLQAIVMENNNIDEKIKESFLKPAYINSKIQYYQVQDVLDYVNQTQLISYKVTRVNLHKTLQLIYDTIELQCKAKLINILFTINQQEFSIEDKPIYLQTDPQRLERILFNLLNKSYRHTPMRGTLRLDVEIFQDTNQIQFKINDNILGFKQEQIDQINSFAKQQNKSTTLFRNSIVKSSKFKFSITLQITNKLIYFLSDFQCSLQVTNTKDEGARYVFFISMNCQRSSFQSADLSQALGSGRSKNSSMKQSMPNHVLLFTRSQAQSCKDRGFDESKIEVEPLANRPLQLSTQMLQTSPVTTLLKSQALQKSIIPFQKQFYQKELIDKSLTISLAFDHSFNIKKIADSIDIRQDMNQTIMLVDDEPFNHDTLKIMLKSLGFKNFISAYNGQQCIEMVQNYHRSIKIIFMDLDMPIMGGVRATSILVSQMQEDQIDYIPIVACTAHDDKETQKECIEAGMIFMIAKPVFLRTLQEAFLKINEIKIKSQNIFSGSKAISSSIK